MSSTLVGDDHVIEPATLPSDELAVERMIDEGSPITGFEPGSPVVCPSCGGLKSERASRCTRCATRGRAARRFLIDEEPSAERRAIERRAAAANRYRVYCFACGRSTSVAAPPARPGRCPSCGGSMLTELETS